MSLSLRVRFKKKLINLTQIYKIPEEKAVFTVLLLKMASARAGFALITPASRGIGFALARQLLVHTDLPVCATARKDCTAVHDKLVKSVSSKRDAAKRLTVLEADVTSKLHPYKLNFSFFAVFKGCETGWISINNRS